MELQLRVEEVQRRVPVTVFHLGGWLNMSTSDDFEKAAAQAVKGGTRYLLLDLSDVAAVRSAGLRSVQRIYNLLHAGHSSASSSTAGQDEPPKSEYLKLANLSPDVYQVFEIAGFLRNIACYPDLEAALDSFE